MSCPYCHGNCTGQCQQSQYYAHPPVYAHTYYNPPLRPTHRCGCGNNCQVPTCCPQIPPTGELVKVRGWAAPTSCDPCGCEVVEDPKTLLCRLLTLLDPGGQAVSGVTLLIGKDCKTYTLPPPASDTPFTPVASPTVAWIPGGVLGHSPRADVEVSSAVGQSITVQGDGLYVPDFCTQLAGRPSAGPATPGATSLLGSDCRFYTLPAYPPAFNLCTSLAGLGNGGAAVPGTTVLVGADCLRYTLPAYPAPVNVCQTIQGFPLTGQATPGVTQLVGADCTLYTVPGQAVFQPNNSSTISWILAGPFNHSPTANAIISPQAGNILVDNLGLYVPAPVSACTQLAARPNSGRLLSGVSLLADDCTYYDFLISADPCNSLQNTVSGLFVPELPTEIVSGGLLTPIVALTNPPLGGTVCPAGPQLTIIPTFVASYTNTSTCRSLVFRPTFSSKVRVQGVTDNNWEVKHSFSTNLGAPIPPTGSDIIAELVNLGGPVGYVTGNTSSRQIEVEGIVIPPGQTLFMSYMVEACAGAFTASSSNLIEVSSFITWAGGYI